MLNASHGSYQGKARGTNHTPYLPPIKGVSQTESNKYFWGYLHTFI